MPICFARAVRFACALCVSLPGMQMPERSPFTSAANTATPASENACAMICSVTVLPVPVAPATIPVPVGYFQDQRLGRIGMAGGVGIRAAQENRVTHPASFILKP